MTDALNRWLYSAYAMERESIPILESHETQARVLQPDMAKRIRQHIDATRRHAERIKGCLERNNAEIPNDFKADDAHFVMCIKGMKADASILDNSLIAHSLEQYEITLYKRIIIAAEKKGDAETIRVARQILTEEEMMSDWYSSSLP